MFSPPIILEQTDSLICIPFTPCLISDLSSRGIHGGECQFIYLLCSHLSFQCMNAHKMIFPLQNLYGRNACWTLFTHTKIIQAYYSV